MAGIARPGKVGFMAAVTFERQTDKLIIYMASCAKGSGMSAIQGKIGGLHMIKLRVVPGDIVVAGRAGSGKTEGGMCRVCRGVKLRLMAGVTFGAYIGISLSVAIVAADIEMPSMKNKGRWMLICRAFPAR